MNKKVLIKLITVLLIVVVFAMTLSACSDIKDFFTINATNLADYANFTYDSGNSKIDFSLKGSSPQSVVVSWDSPVVFNVIYLYENGNNVKGFEIIINDSVVYKQDEIGKMRAVYLGTTTTSSLTIKITDSNGSFNVSDIGIYNLPRKSTFKSTAFISLADDSDPLKETDTSLFKNYTDTVLYFPCLTYNEQGQIIADIAKIKSVITRIRAVNINIKIHIIIKPTEKEKSTDNTTDPDSLRNNVIKDYPQEFATNLQKFISQVKADGIVMDFIDGTTILEYGYYNDFIDVLRGELISPYEISVFIKPNNSVFNKKTKSYIDNFFVVTQDIYTNEENYPSYQDTVCSTFEKLKDSDIPVSKSQITIPCYGFIPASDSEFYLYKDYADKLGKFSNSLQIEITSQEEEQTTETVYFNGYTLTKDKACLAYDYGANGIVLMGANFDILPQNGYSLIEAVNSVVK